MQTVSQKIDLIQELKKFSAPIAKKNKNEIDYWTGVNSWNGVYTSKHIVYGLRVVKQAMKLRKNSKKRDEELQIAREKLASHKLGQVTAPAKPGQPS